MNILIAVFSAADAALRHVASSCRHQHGRHRLEHQLHSSTGVFAGDFVMLPVSNTADSGTDGRYATY